MYSSNERDSLLYEVVCIVVRARNSIRFGQCIQLITPQQVFLKNCAKIFCNSGNDAAGWFEMIDSHIKNENELADGLNSMPEPLGSSLRHNGEEDFQLNQIMIDLIALIDAELVLPKTLSNLPLLDLHNAVIRGSLLISGLKVRETS